MPTPSNFHSNALSKGDCFPKPQKGKLRLRELRSRGWCHGAASGRAGSQRVCWDQSRVLRACSAAFLPWATVSAGPALQTANFPLEGLLEGREGEADNLVCTGLGLHLGLPLRLPSPDPGGQLSPRNGSPRLQYPMPGRESARTLPHFQDLETETQKWWGWEAQAATTPRQALSGTFQAGTPVPCPALPQATPPGSHHMGSTSGPPESVQKKGLWTEVPSSRTQWVGGSCDQSYLGIPISIGLAGPRLTPSFLEASQNTVRQQDTQSAPRQP